MDFARAFRFPFGDTNWVSKLLIGTLVSLVPILNFAAYGYAADVTRDVANGRETPLPEWNNFGTTWVRGLKIVAIQFLYSLPLYVLLCPLYIAVIASTANSPDGEPSGAALGLLGCGGLLIVLLGIALAPIIMAASARFSVSDRFGDALPGPTLAMMRGNWRPWIMAILYLVAASLAVGLVSACSFGLLAIPLVFYIQVVTAHWYAQAYRASAGSYGLSSSMV